MKIKCIKENIWYSLTIGKIYEVIKEDVYDYLIINDKNIVNRYPKSYFKPLSEIRNEKINKLLE